MNENVQNIKSHWKIGERLMVELYLASAKKTKLNKKLFGK